MRRRSLFRAGLLAVPFAGLVLLSVPVAAQITAPSPDSKSSYPAAPRPYPVQPPIQAPMAPAPLNPAPSSIGGNDPSARQLETTLPLDPATRNLQNQAPPNPGAVESQLGLREPVGPVTDLRGRVPTPQEIVNGLNKR